MDDSDVNPSLAGIYTVIYSATDSSSNIQTYEYYVTFAEESSGELTLTGYYSSANGMTGSALINRLRIIINSSYVGKNYDYARQALWDTDKDPNNSSNLIEFYTGNSIPGIWDSGITWNREHVWPQSLLGVSAGGVNAASDIHNLKPSNPSINSSRGNKYYYSVTTSASFYPTRTAIHGDIARMLFYMVIMYDIYSLVDAVPTVNQMAWLSILLQWHLNDPVDDFERNRNDRIYYHQGNRNPFIDYPELIQYLDIATA
jgi:endonuclease I